MSDEPKTRAQRREEARDDSKYFEHLLRQIRCVLDQRPDDEYRAAVNKALAELEKSKHLNRRIALEMVIASMVNVREGNLNGARYLLFMSGVVVDDALTSIHLDLALNGEAALGRTVSSNDQHN